MVQIKMRLPRYSIRQLFLAATLVALVLGLFASAARIGLPDSICQFCFSPSGKHLAARYESGTVHVWQLDQDEPRLVAQAFGTPRLPATGAQWMLEALYFVQDDRLLKLESDQAGSRVNVRELEIATGKVSEVLQIPQQSAQQQWVTATADRLYVTQWSTNNVRCYDLVERRLERQYTVGSEDIWSLALSADGKTLVVTDFKETVHAIDTVSGQSISTLPDVPLGINAMALSPDGTRLVAPVRPSLSGGGVIQRVVFFDTRHGGEPEDWPTTLKGGPIWVAASRDGQRLAVCDQQVATEFYDVPNKKLLRRITHDELYAAAANFTLGHMELTADGNTFVVSSGDRIMFWDVASGKLRQTLGGGTSRILPVSIFTFGFALWAAVWGIVRKRDRARPPSNVDGVTWSHAASQGRPDANSIWVAAPPTAIPAAVRENSLGRRLVVACAWLGVAAILVVELNPTRTFPSRDARSLMKLAAAIVSFSCLYYVLSCLGKSRRSTAPAKNRHAASLSDELLPLSAPLSLKVCWGLMLAGGLIALVVPIGFLFLNPSNMLWTSYYSLFLGIVAISRGASRDTLGLGRVVVLQAASIIAFDPINLMLAAIEQFLLCRPRVKQFLLAATE